MQSLIRREGHLIVLDDERQAADGEGPPQPPVSRNDRILAVAPNYVIDWCGCAIQQQTEKNHSISSKSAKMFVISPFFAMLSHFTSWKKFLQEGNEPVYSLEMNSGRVIRMLLVSPKLPVKNLFMISLTAYSHRVDVPWSHWYAVNWNWSLRRLKRLTSRCLLRL